MAAFADRNVLIRPGLGLGVQDLQGIAEQRMHRDRPAALALAGRVGQVDGIADPAIGVGHHGPGQARDLLGPHPGFEAQQDEDAVPLRVAGATDVIEDDLDLLRGEGLGLLTLAHREVLTQEIITILLKFF
jgi:hypothetical protein